MSFFVAGPSRSRVTAPQRPLALVATLGGASAALISLVPCLVISVIGWYLTDAGAHGSAAGGLKVGAIGWLTGHGTGLNLAGVTISPLPLAITALILWVTWQVGLRVGGQVAAHGPDADGIRDGSRDLVVPTAGLLFVFGYLVVTVIVASLAGGGGLVTASSAMSAALMVSLFVGLPAIALDSGRLAQWLEDVPEDLRGVLAGVRGLLVGWLIAASVAFVVGVLFHGLAIINLISEAHVSGGSLIPYLGAMLLVLPNAVVYAGSYLIGAPFTVGIGSSISPSHVELIARPGAIPWTAATPTAGSGWLNLILIVPVAISVVVAWRLERRTPAPSPIAAAIRAAAYSLIAALGIGLLGWWAGGAIGTGLSLSFGSSGPSMFLHALEWILAPSVVAAGAASWWDRRRAAVVAED